MRSRLFWKILFAYGLTFFLVVQVVGLLLLARMNLERETGPRFEPPQLAAAQAVLETGGLESYAAFRERLTDKDRRDLQISAADGTPSAEDQPDATRSVTTPDGETYTLTLKQGRFGGPKGVPLPPWEVLLVGALGGLAFSAALAFYLTIPIRKLRSGFARLAGGELEARIGSAMGRRNDEIAGLGQDFDIMARRLQMLVDARVRLLHDVSHEFRSPLARIHMATSLIEQSPANTERCLARINHEVDQLNALVEELLTLTRIEAGGLTLQLEDIDLVGLTESVLADAEFESEDNPDRLTFLRRGLPKAGPAPGVCGDPQLIKRAIENIVRNALKYSPQDTPVTVGLELSADARTYTVEVRDEGPGVDPDMLDTMFDPFVRHGEKTKGYGLGLAIAKRAIEAHGGAIRASVNHPHGLSMRVTLPTS